MRELAIEYIKYSLVRSYNFTVVNHTVFRSAIYAVLCDNAKRLFGFVPFKIYEAHTHIHEHWWRADDESFFFHLGLSPPRDAHTHAKMMSAPENGSLFTSEWIQHFANKIYYKFIVLNAAEEFCMEIIFRKPHTIYRWLWCAVVNTHAGWTWQLDAFLNLRYPRHWVCSAAPKGSGVDVLLLCCL